jgi:DNA-binding phage protein
MMPIDSPDLPQRYFKKAIQKNMENITLDAEMIRLLMAIDENKNISQVARAAEMNLPQVRNTLSKLLELKLVLPVTKDTIYLKQSFIEFLKTKLSEAVGPMGEILIEDILDEMGLQIDRIPVNTAPDFLGNIAREIPQVENRTVFKNAVFSQIPKT